MVAPLKLEGTAGDLKEITTTEENYIAYLAGLQLAAMADTDVSALTTTAGGNTVGAYTNTFYNEAVGTHPGTSITSGSVITTLYQNTGTASESSGDFHRPIRWAGSGNIEEMDNTEFNEVVDRLLTTIFTNDYPGAYRLASSSPGVDWDIHLASVFTDTQSSGVTAATYNIYQRQTMTAPTTVKSVKILNDTTAFDGLKEMNATEMQVTFGQRAKNRIVSSANYIGAYQLRSSVQGAPTDPGTWVAKGTATDTKDTTSDVDYAANYVGNYSGVYSADYSANYIGIRATDYSANYQINRAQDVNYQRSRAAISGTFYSYAAGIRYTYYSYVYYLGDYIGTLYYLGDYIGNYVGNFAGDYIGNYIGNYTGAYAGDYIGNYLGETISAIDTTVETYTLYVRTA